MPDHADARVGTIAVPGATIYYKIRGRGPLLLLLQGGDGDADAGDGLAAELADRYTVLSYDRRGLSRSTATDGSAAVDLAVHSDDAARLVAAVSDGPVAVFGTSLGAVLGLDLLSRHPECVRVLVAHEPPVTELLDEPDRSLARQGQRDVETAYSEEGVAAAMRRFGVLAGMRFDDREPDVVLPEPRPERLANLEYFLTHDAPAVRNHRLAIPELLEYADRVVPGAGISTDTFPRRCAEALAVLLNQPLIEFPGGHNGWLLRPRAFGARLRQVLGAQTGQGIG